jgi:hypothetical protein
MIRFLPRPQPDGCDSAWENGSDALLVHMEFLDRSPPNLHTGSMTLPEMLVPDFQNVQREAWTKASL